MRPHELEIDRIPSGVGSLLAEVQRINGAGSVAKVFLVAEEFGLGLNVELSRERLAELELKTGDNVYVSPQRVRVFMPEYVI